MEQKQKFKFPIFGMLIVGIIVMIFTDLERSNENNYIEMMVLEDTITTRGLYLRINNNTPDIYSYGGMFHLEIKEEGLWEVFGQETAFLSVEYLIAPRSYLDLYKDLNIFQQEIVSGHYRILKPVNRQGFEEITLTAEFVIP